MAKQDNAIRLCGRIVNRYDRGHVIILTLRIAETVRGEERVNYPRVYFFREDNTGADNFFLHDEVALTAHVATPRKYRNSGEEYISQAFVGDSIERRKGMYELLNMEGMGRGPLEPQTNTVVFTGTLTSIRKIGDKSAQVVVETINEGHHRNDITANVASTDVFKMQIGSRVTITGKVVTGYYEQDENGRRHRPEQRKAENSEIQNSDNPQTEVTAAKTADSDAEKKKRTKIYYQHILGLSIATENQ